VISAWRLWESKMQMPEFWGVEFAYTISLVDIRAEKGRVLRKGVLVLLPLNPFIKDSYKDHWKFGIS
jgi:hypothetical protein